MIEANGTAAGAALPGRNVPDFVQFYVYCCVSGFAVRSILSDSTFAARERA
jgi:hypothetical protein